MFLIDQTPACVYQNFVVALAADFLPTEIAPTLSASHVNIFKSRTASRYARQFIDAREIFAGMNWDRIVDFLTATQAVTTALRP